MYHVKKCLEAKKIIGHWFISNEWCPDPLFLGAFEVAKTSTEAG